MQVIVTILHKYTLFAVFRPVYVRNVRYIRKLSDLSVFYCLDVQLYHLCGKRRFVCAHIGQNRDIYPPSIFRLHFRLVPPPPFAQVDGGGCYREKFFLILFFRFSYSISTRILFFLFFQISSLYSSDFDFPIIGS